jgi:hypothetical protein
VSIICSYAAAAAIVILLLLMLLLLLLLIFIGVIGVTPSPNLLVVMVQIDATMAQQNSNKTVLDLPRVDR